MKRLNKKLIILTVFVLSSCSSLSSLKFWGDDEEEEYYDDVENLYDVFTRVRDDEAEHVKTMQECQIDLA